MAKRKSFSEDSEIERSLRHSIKDGVLFSVMTGSAESYFSAFAVLLRANTAQIGLIATLPPLVASFFQLFSVWFGRRTGQRKWIIVIGACLQALALVPLAILPLVFPDQAVPLLLIFAMLYFIGPHLGSPQWGSLMGALVPEGKRGKFFALRTRLASAASFSALIAAGFVLQLFDKLHHAAYGFLTIFLVAALARAASAWQLSRMVDPKQSPPAEPLVSTEDLIKRILASRFIRFSAFFAAMQFAVAISGPFIVVHMLRDLNFSYVELTFNSAMSVLFQIITLTRWGRLSDIFGNRLILVVTGFTIPFIPTLWVLSSNYYYLLAVQALSGVVWSGFTLSATNFIFDLTLPHKRATYMAIHGTIAATAVFLGASFGGWLATILPDTVSLGGLHFHWDHTLYGVFLTATIVRLAVATAFLPRLEEVRRVRNTTATALIYRVVRFSNVNGLVFDPVLRLRKTNPETGPGTDEGTPEQNDKDQSS